MFFRPNEFRKSHLEPVVTDHAPNRRQHCLRFRPFTGHWWGSIIFLVYRDRHGDGRRAEALHGIQFLLRREAVVLWLSVLLHELLIAVPALNIAPMADKRSNLCPTLCSDGLDGTNQELIFFTGPRELLQFRIDNSKPPLRTLASRTATSHALGHQNPVFRAVGLDGLCQFPILLGGPSLGLLALNWPRWRPEVLLELWGRPREKRKRRMERHF